jgi:hypothetical protein
MLRQAQHERGGKVAVEVECFFVADSKKFAIVSWLHDRSYPSRQSWRTSSGCAGWRKFPLVLRSDLIASRRIGAGREYSDHRYYQEAYEHKLV